MELHPAYPNPFNPTTTLQFDLSLKTSVGVVITNIVGQAVRVYEAKSLEAGKHSMTFDGKDNFGQALTSGVYFIRFITNVGSETQKVVLVK
jgi:flagellar hook assembly protein FlgD